MNRSVEDHEPLRLVGSLRASMVAVGVFSLFVNLLMLVPPLYMLQVYDRVLTSRSEATLLFLTLLVVWMFATQGLLEFVRARILIRVATRIDTRLNPRLYRAMLQVSLRKPAAASVQPMQDLASVRQFLVGNGPLAFFDTPWVPVYLGLLFLFHPAFGAFAVAAALSLLVLALLNERSTRHALLSAGGAQRQAGAELDAQLRNAEVLHAMGMDGGLQQRWQRHHLAALGEHGEAADRASIWTTTSRTLRLLFQSLMLGLGGYLAIANQISPGMVIAGSIIMGRALAPIDQLIGHWKPFVAARAAYGRLRQLLAAVPEQRERLSMPAPQGAVEVSGVSLTPPGATAAVLKGLSFSLTPGQTLAVIGPSGAGKSSLVRALLGVWPLDGGAVRVDGAEVDHWNRHELGPCVGYLPQDIELFSGTVAENIARFGDLNAERIHRAAVLADVDALIRRLPNGYETAIGANGVALSAGQRQRIGLARALYGDPTLVVLDEPDSNLDEQGQRALLEACRALKQRGATVVMISHRHSFLAFADRVLVLNDGRLALFGARDAVLDKLAGLSGRSEPQRAVVNLRERMGEAHG